ncbi:MAG: hypothetical protein EOO47_27180 [Flavobacterium sp.]|nr:MAG: hypothetical protein EOO47_27180 [Flavobacterium sp.]
MFRIDFKAFYGDIVKNVTLSAPNGGGGGGYNILIDNYLQGVLFKRNDIWVGFFNKKDNDFTAADIDILGNIIDSQNLME